MKLLYTLLLAAVCGAALAADKPNIVVILADDLGYGDPQCYNPQGKIPTPHIDKLAAQGMRFTDGHSSSSICTPSRYTLLTGRYHWRSPLRDGVLNGMGKPIIPPERLTIAGLLKQHGYATACIGKWHLGMDMPSPLTTGAIQNGPTTNGFDYYFGISASLDMPPYAFIENDRFTEAPTAKKNLLILKSDQPLVRAGPAAPNFESEQVLPAFAQKSVDWIKAQNDKPFFLYLPLNSPHTPLAATKEWKGKSGLGDYADFVMQTDAVVGEVVAAIDAIGATRNTIVILSSDNGPANYVGTKVSDDPQDSHEGSGTIKNLEAKGHFPASPLRGYKASIHEGGHRVPFIVRWPEVVKPNSRSNQLVHQADFMRTFADIIGATLPDNAGEDSISLLPLLQGVEQPVREHAINGRNVPSLRHGSWKLILAPDKENHSPDRPLVQLYNLTEDLSETNNLASKIPEKVSEMEALLKKLIAEGRSTPGTKQQNDLKEQKF